MRRMETDPGMTRIEVVVSERELLEVQSLLDAPTPSDAVRILISNKLAAERAKRDEQEARRRPRVMPEEAPPEFVKRQPSEDEWQERRENVGERRWRKSGPVVEEPAKKDEHPIRAYQRRVQEEEQHEQRARRGGSLERGNNTGRPGGRPGGAGARPGPRPGGTGGNYGARPSGPAAPYGARAGAGRPAEGNGPPRPGSSGPRPGNSGPRPGGNGPRPSGLGRPGPGANRPPGRTGGPGGRSEGGPPSGPRRGPR